MIALSRTRAALLVVDLQERLAPAMTEPAQLVRNACILIETAKVLGLPIVVSQQYPKGLGATIAPIEEALAGASATRLHRFDKLEFSAAATHEFAALAPQLRRDQWLICGIEAHVCIYQTARGLVDRGDQAYVIADAVASRTPTNARIGLELCARAGAIVTSTEVCVFDLLGRAGTDEFKALSKLIR